MAKRSRASVLEETTLLRCDLPIYVERQGDVHQVRLLFSPDPVAEHPLLDRALSMLARDVRTRLEELLVARRHEALYRLIRSPEIVEDKVALHLVLKRRSLKGTVRLVTYRALGGRIAFSPRLPELCFPVLRGHRLSERAHAVFEEHLKRIAKEDPESFDAVAEALCPSEGKRWVTQLPLEVTVPWRPIEKEEQRFALFGGGEQVEGGDAELRRTGRYLDARYPDDLDEAFLRDREVAGLERALSRRPARPVLLLGPPGVGKTAIVHAYVRNTVKGRGGPHGERRRVVLLSPQRIISGMSYVGQWEERLLAIVEAARARQHILYFDDVLGLLDAGVTSRTKLSVAHVLRPLLERGELTVVAEMTPEQFGILKERDRPFADLFDVLRIEEPSELDTARMLIRLQQGLEERYRVRMDETVLEGILSLTRRYARSSADPGRGADLMRRLALKFEKRTVYRYHVYLEVQDQSGLPLFFLDELRPLATRTVREELAAHVLGQDHAIAEVAEVVAVAKARLQDPGRPLATCLFLGPTGVGKTQLAKTLAAYLFTDPERLLRFDMNEFADPGASARLVGTFRNPEGLLTAAIRRRPFAVLLFDEIEKADPSVHDIMLQLLGEGRLTDGRGRTADFTNTIVVLTSNLGVTDATGGIGFVERSAKAVHDSFVRAAERFFRPELFNRIDRVVPFTRLGEEHVHELCQLEVERVLSRQGLRRRRAVLSVDVQALNVLAERGVSPELGARALKRVVERELARPVARRLAALAERGPRVIEVLSHERELRVEVAPLRAAPRSELASDLARLPLPAIFTAIEAALERIALQIEDAHDAPQDGPIAAEGLSPSAVHRFDLRERHRKLADRLQRIGSWSQSGESPGAESKLAGRSRPPWRPFLAPSFVDPEQRERVIAGLFRATNLEAFVQRGSLIPRGADVEQRARLRDLAGEVALLDALSFADVSQPERALMLVRAVGTSGGRFWGAASRFRSAFTGVGLQVTEIVVDVVRTAHAGEHATAFVIEGPLAQQLVQLEAGAHALIEAEGGLSLVQVVGLPLLQGETPADALGLLGNADQRWLTGELGAGVPRPYAVSDVLRVHPTPNQTHALDLRTGLLVQLSSTEAEQRDMRAALLGALPAFPELTLLGGAAQSTGQAGGGR